MLPPGGNKVQGRVQPTGLEFATCGVKQIPTTGHDLKAAPFPSLLDVLAPYCELSRSCPSLGKRGLFSRSSKSNVE